MKPAFSVIFLTTLIGAGQGLFIAQICAHLLVLITLLPEPAHSSELTTAGAVSLLLLLAGLFASFFHLGHPERAWRAAAMWRTSWLSREVIALPATVTLILAFTIAAHFSPQTVAFTLANDIDVALHTVIGVLAAITAVVLYVFTAMIYACLKFLRQWHTPLTVFNFFLFGTASGCSLATLIAVYYNSPHTSFYCTCAIVFTILAGLGRSLSLIRNRSLRNTSSLQSATGIHHPTIRQMAQGAMGGSFNTRAFIHTYTPTFVKLARRYFLVAAFILPAGLLYFVDSTVALWIPLAAFLIQYSGLLAERWYFFVEAEHPQNAYYQMIS